MIRIRIHTLENRHLMSTHTHTHTTRAQLIFFISGLIMAEKALISASIQVRVSIIKSI